ncbi:MAG: hypothetical protein H6797_03785 [Candidatus Nomurabacteria bacterium]|nr:MAG: hypothetical protein H6797_03785 [Candidatus Nomurabacteria bacterium]
MARLPTPGGDSGNWGTILNTFLSQVHASDGTLKTDSVTSDAIAPNAVTTAAIAPAAITVETLAPNTIDDTVIADGSITNALIADGTIEETKLATAVQTKLNEVAPVTSVASKTGAVSLTKTDVGLDQVDNTSDATKNAATATLTNKTLASAQITGTNEIQQSGTLVFYNTADQTTNYERARARWGGNAFWLETDQGGTGAGRDIVLASSSGVTFALSAATGNKATLAAPSGIAGANQLLVNGSLMGSSSTQNSLSLSPTINQSSTAGYTALLINPTETATGSGTKRLIDAQVGGASKFVVDNAGNVSLGSTALTGSTTPVYLDLGGSVGSNTVGTSGNLKLKFYTGYGIGISAGVQEYQVPAGGNSHKFYVAGTERFAITPTDVTVGGASVVTTTGTQTLTNKTLTTPKVDIIKDATQGLSTLALYAPASAVNYVQAVASITGTNVGLYAQGTDTNIGISLNPKGTGKLYTGGVEVVTTSGTQTLTNKTLTNPKINMVKDAFGNNAIEIGSLASAANYFTVANSVAGQSIGVWASGSDTDIGINLNSKGVGGFQLRSPTSVAFRAGFQADSTVNYLYAVAHTTGNAPYLMASGTDTNINLNLTTKGTGTVQANGVDVVTTTGTQSLTNKTLTNPKIDAIYDPAGNKHVSFSDQWESVYLSPFNRPSLQVSAYASSVNYVRILGQVAGGGPLIQALGNDANIHLELNSKGTGEVRVNYVPVVTTTGTQTLTNKTISGSSNTLSNIAQSSVTSLTTDLANRAEVTVYNSANVLKSVSLNTNPENGWYTFEPNYSSDLTYNLLRGGAIDVQKNGLPFNTYGSGTGFYNVGGGTVADNWFRADTSFCLDNPAVSTDTYIITVDIAPSILQRYGCNVGIVFPHGWGTKDVQIEIYKGGWSTVYSVTNNSDPVHRYYYTGDGTTYTKIRYTLGRPWDAQVRISSLFSYAYNSPGRADGYLPRGGGAVYGSNSAPVAFTATGGDSNISINMVPKGTGTLNQNGVPVATTTGAQTLTNKTLTSPSISGPIISDGYIRDANANVMMAFNAVASAVNYLQISNRATGGAPVTLRAIGSDTNVNLSLASQGSGTVQINGVDAVDVSSAQTLTNKTLTSPKVNRILATNGTGVLDVTANSGAVNATTIYNSATGVAPYLESYGSDTHIGFNIKTKGTGVVQANGVEVATVSGTQALTNKTLSGANNTITDIPASATPDAARKVWTSLSTVSGQWTKVLTYTPGNTTLDRISLCLSFVSFAHNTSAIVALEAGITSNTSSASIELLSKAAGTALGADSFKIISDGSGAAFELWIKAYNNGSAIVVSEISRYTHVGTLAYTPGVAFQGTVPTGASVNAQTSSVTAGGAPVVTTTGTQTLTNKTLTSPTLTAPVIGSGGAPASASSAGTTGTVAWDSSYVYICVATNTWVRASLTTW